MLTLTCHRNSRPNRLLAMNLTADFLFIVIRLHKFTVTKTLEVIHFKGISGLKGVDW